VVSFRYHLVSLSAVLFALSVGVVVGSVALGPAPAPAVVRPAAISRAPAEAFARAVGPRLIKGALAGQRVLVLLAPDAHPGGLVDELGLAGASVTGQLRLRAGLLDPGSAATVDDVVTRVLPAGLSLTQQTPAGRAGAVLAAVLAASTRGTDASSADQQTVLGAFTGAGLLAGAVPQARATLVLLVADATRGAALADLAAAFQERVGVVVAVPAAQVAPAGVLAVLRAQTGALSDVDGALTPQGLVATVLALAEQAGGGSGHYGTAPGAGGLVPDLS